MPIIGSSTRLQGESKNVAEIIQLIPEGQSQRVGQDISKDDCLAGMSAKGELTANSPR